jgi:NADH-quinone oxidoreductase subunit C
MATFSEMASLGHLERCVRRAFSSIEGAKLILNLNEITLDVPLDRLKDVMLKMRDDESLQFDSLSDLTAVDYLDFKPKRVARFAMVYHLLSTKLNHRVRVRAMLTDAKTCPTMIPVWQNANWLEREVFDMFGIVFEGHPDLRRILTDYGFEGNPLLKDFPCVGNLEMHYDKEQGKVVYGPVTVEMRENIHRVRREAGFADEKPMTPPKGALAPVRK